MGRGPLENPEENVVHRFANGAGAVEELLSVGRPGPALITPVGKDADTVDALALEVREIGFEIPGVGTSRIGSTHRIEV
jgi:hypothetical protein